MTHTLLIIIVTTLISVAAWKAPNILNQLLFNPVKVKRGEVHRFVTHGLIHADGTHLLFNMITLYFFGTAIEQLYRQFLGGFGFLVFYILAVVAAIIPSYLSNINNAQYNSLGASGGVSAILFAFILIAPWEKLYLFFAIPIPAIVFAIAYVGYSIYANQDKGSRINHSAHLWGGAFGVLATIAIRPDLISRFFYLIMHPKF